MNRRNQLIPAFFLLSVVAAYGQKSFSEQEVLSDYVSGEKVKTIQLYRQEWNLSYPFFKLDSEEKLLLNFDILGNDSEDLYYRFIHCDKDWKRSDIFENDYTEGFAENPVEDYKPSFNTTVNYYHYKVIFPNDRVRLTISGNYIILVYPAGKPDEPVLARRFIVTENSAAVKINIHRPLMTENNNSGQQVDFTVSQFGRNISDPYRQIYAFILQNGRWDNAKKNLKPEFYSNNELKYNIS